MALLSGQALSNNEVEIALHFELERSLELRERIFGVYRDIESTLDHWDEYKHSEHYNDVTFEKFVYAAVEQDTLHGGNNTATSISALRVSEAADVFNFHLTRSRRSRVVDSSRGGGSEGSSFIKARPNKIASHAVGVPRISRLTDILAIVRSAGEEGGEEEREGGEWGEWGQGEDEVKSD